MSSAGGSALMSSTARRIRGTASSYGRTMNAPSAVRMVAGRPSCSAAPSVRRRPSSGRVSPCAIRSAERVNSKARINAACSAPASTPWKQSAASSMRAAPCTSAGSPVNTAWIARSEITLPRSGGETLAGSTSSSRVFDTCTAPAATAASAAPTRRAFLVSPAGVRAAAWASTLARERNPPRWPARSATRSSRSATSGSVPSVAFEACQAPSSTRAWSAAASDSARCTRRRSGPGAEL